MNLWLQTGRISTSIENGKDFKYVTKILAKFNPKCSAANPSALRIGGALRVFLSKREKQSLKTLGFKQGNSRYLAERF